MFRLGGDGAVPGDIVKLPRDSKGRLNPKLVGVLTGIAFGLLTEFGGLLLVPRIYAHPSAGWTTQLALVSVIGAVWVTMGTYLAVSYGRRHFDR